jgi:hypothetical protein
MPWRLFKEIRPVPGFGKDDAVSLSRISPAVVLDPEKLPALLGKAGGF